MGNLCCGEDRYKDYQKLDHKSYRENTVGVGLPRQAITPFEDIVDKVIYETDLLPFVKNNSQSCLDITLSLYGYRSAAATGTTTAATATVAAADNLNVIAESKSIRQIVFRLIIALRKIGIETNNSHNSRSIIISRNSIYLNHADLVNIAASGTAGTADRENLEVHYDMKFPKDYELMRSSRYKLYIKILPFKISHLYDNNILYQTESKNYYRSEECVICLDNPANVLYLGCMHLHVCTKCHTNPRDPNFDFISNGRRNCPSCMIWTGYKDNDWKIIPNEKLETNYSLTRCSK